MTGAFRIAEGYVEVTADQSSYDTSMEKLTSTKHTVQVGVDLDDADALARLVELAKSRIAQVDIDLTGLAAFTQLTEETQDRTTRVQVELDEGDVVLRLDELTRERTINIKVDLDDSSLTGLADHSYTADIIAVVDQAYYDRAKAKLDKLTADRFVQIRADVDTRVGAAEIRNLIQRRTARIGVDVDTRVAAADLANLTRARTARINANVNAGDARARLDALARDRRSNIDVNVRSGGLSSLTGLGGGLGSITSSISGLVAAAVGALPTIASLGESLIQMGPAAAIAAPAVLSLATAFAAVKLGTSGISDAFKAAFAPAEQGAKAAASSTKAVEAAQRSLVKAEQNVKDTEVAVAAARIKAARDVADAQQNLKNTVQQVADANRSAAEQVAAAERDLTTAQKAAAQAQKDLTQARKDAAQQLEDLNNQFADAQLSQRQDVLNLQDAERNLALVKAQGASATAEQLAKAQLAYDQAKQALQEQQLETQRLQDKTDAANKAGVEGSATVTAAKQTVADTTQTVADKTQALADAEIQASRAQTNGAQQIAKAERDLADARAAQVKAATDGARQIADANQAVADAAQALAEAQTAGALATNKLGDALAKLSPQARAFVNAVIDQRAAWRSLKLDVQDRLFSGLGSTFTRLSTAVLPSVRIGLTGTAGVLNTMAKNAANAVVQLAKTGTLRKMFDGLTNGLRPLSRLPGQIVTALVQLSVAAAPAFKRLTTAVGNAADSISKKLTGAFNSGALGNAINTALGIAKQFGHLLGDIFGTVGNVMKAAAAGGGDALGTLGAVFKELRKVTAMPEVQKALTSIFTAVNAIAKLIAGTLGAVIKAALPLLATLAPVITELATALGPSLAGLAQALGDALLPIAKQLAPILGTVGNLLIGVVTAITPLLKPIGELIGAVITALAPVFNKVVSALLLLVNSLSGPLTDIIASLVPMAGPLLQLFTSLSMAMLPLVPQILQLVPPLGQLIVALLNLTTQVLIPLLPLINLLAQMLAGVLGGALSILIPVLNTVIGALTTFTNAITAAVKWVVDKFQWLYDVLVGHSIIPDLVNEIIGWFGKLWTGLKRIVTGLVRDVVDLFTSMWRQVRQSWASFWSAISSSISSARSWIGGAFNGLRNTVTSTWSSMWNAVSSKFSTIISGIKGGISNFASAAKTAFSTLRDSIGTIWNGIREKLAAPVRFVVSTVYNNGIRKMWDTIAGKVGLPQLPQVKLGFNTGGVVPGQGRRDTVPAMLTPGERVLSLAQVAKLGGHAAIDRMVGKGGSKGPHYGLGSIGGVVGSVTGTVTNAVSGAIDWTKNIVLGGLEAAARKAISAVVNPLIDRIPVAHNALGDLIKGIPRSALNGILGALGKKDKDAAASGQISYTAGAGVAQWAPQILQALSLLGQSSSWLGTVERRMNQESGGNPQAQNLWDSNAKAGYPSTGLMQVIRPTFHTYGGPFVDTGPFMNGVSVDPLANTYAGLNYAQHRYGSLSALNRPGGYDSGGLLMPGATMAVNRTGRPERVLNADHTARLDALLAGGGGVTIQELKISGTFDFTTPAARRQAAQELVEEMKEALRTLDNSRQRGGRRS